MGFVTLDRMKEALLSAPVSPLERIVLLDMAVAVQDGAPTYTWGHDRLALALGREPGLKATKSALERVLSALTSRGLIVRTGAAHRGRHAEYRLAVLELKGPRSERGPFVAVPAEKGPRFEGERAPVFPVKGPGLSGAPLPVSLPVPLPGNGHRTRRPTAKVAPPSAKQRAHLADLRAALEGLETERERVTGPTSTQEADDLIGLYRAEAHRRAHNGEPFDCPITDLSPDARRYYEGRGLADLFPDPWVTEREETA